MENADWTYIAQNRDQWEKLVNKIMKVWVPNKVEKFLIR